MPLDTALLLPIVLPIALGLVLALALGALARRLRLPALVGYIVAGALVGTLAGPAAATPLVEAGLVLAMFGLGLKVSLRDVTGVRLGLVPAALLACAGTVALGLVAAMLMDWPTSAGLIFGLALAAPSLIGVRQGLDDRHLRASARGQAVAGWGLVTSLVMVLALVLLPALAAVMGGAPTVPRDPFVGVFERFTGLRADGWLVAAIVVVKFAAFIGFMIVVGRRVVPWGLAWVAATGSRELSRLAVAALALAVAAGAAYLFGTSLALGAFFAGMILREDDLANRAARAVLPLREAFAVPLFVGIGMLAEPRLLGAAPLPLLGTLLVILVARPVLTGLAGALTRQPVGTLVPAAAQLAQIGEFAVLLGVTGVGLGLLPAAGGDLIVLGVAFSLVVNPALVRLADMARPRLEAGLAARRPGVVLPNRVEPALAGTAPAPAEAAAPAAGETRPPTLKAGHVVLVGYGRVGRVVADGLSRQNTPFVVIEAAEARAAAALAAGLEAFAGNAATAEPQALANVAGAKTLLVSGGDGFEAGQVVARARRSNPALTIVARARDAAEADHLRAAGATEVITGAREIGLGLLGWSNGDNAHEAATTRARESFEAVAAALKLEALPPAPVEPVLPVAAPAAVPPAVPPAAPPLGRAERPATRAGVPYRAAGE